MSSHSLSRDDPNHILEGCDKGSGTSNETVQRVLEGAGFSNGGTRTRTGWGKKSFGNSLLVTMGSSKWIPKTGKGTTFRIHIPIERVAEAQTLT
ncbi:MAG TPA: hypothetical protein VNK96_08425 [Fimbriimonadales bacterium]|nr:hypothetical protein [Fimbriimonadales bacterium]